MEVFYGIVVLLAFILGLGIGISVPFFVKKYAETQKVEVKTKEAEQEDKFRSIPNDLLKEWITGEEVKANDEQ
jgi:uncharacterized alpha/beta hydrolase family protein